MKNVEKIQLTPEFELIIDHKREIFILHHKSSSTLIYLESKDTFIRLGLAITASWLDNTLNSDERPSPAVRDTLAKGYQRYLDLELEEIADETKN